MKMTAFSRARILVVLAFVALVFAISAGVYSMASQPATTISADGENDGGGFGWG